MESTYYGNLIRSVIDNSNSNVWENAVLEWDIDDCEEDEDLKSSCICGKENLRYLYTIRNRINQNTLYPIGSSCIKKFARADMKEETTVREGMFKLLRAVKENEYISLSADLFSRKLLLALYEARAFSNAYNQYDGENDYQFLLKMFNKRDKDSITKRQRGKINAIILHSIKPYLMQQLAGKVKE